MALPKRALPTGVIALGDELVSIRGLSRTEAYHMTTLSDDPEAAETYILIVGTDSSEKDVRQWRESTTFGDVQAVVTGILELSGLTETAGNASAEGS